MHTINDLVAAKLISQFEANIYTLYVDNPIGADYLRAMVDETFMDVPAPDFFNKETLAYCAGRRAVFQQIKSVIAKIDKLKTEELQNDRPSDEPERKFNPANWDRNQTAS